MKILIIEDSKRLNKSLCSGFTHLGYVVDSAEDGAEGLRYALTYQYDAIILDLMLPSLDGLSILRKLRDKRNKTPVLILSAKDEISERIQGLDLGADDYLCKPFAFDELVARITTIVRRNSHLKTNIISNGNCCLDIGKRQASINSEVLSLTPHEYSILECLLLHCDNVVTYEKLENYLYDSHSSVTRNAIEAHVSGLRKKISLKDGDLKITTRRGFGYIIDINNERS